MTGSNLALVGLGKLGLPLAACYADAGLSVLGVDLQPGVVEAVNRGESPLAEPGLDGLLRAHGGKKLTATMDAARAVAETDATIILVATPSLPDGSFSNVHVEAALGTLADALRENPKPYHLFIISSTVVPGSTLNSFVPLIEQRSGRKLNEGFGVAFDPDFVALGSVVKDFKKPDMVIIGQSDERAGAAAEALHRRMCENDPPVFRMSLANAEVAKVCLNAYITMKISFANAVANLCERIPGGDADAVTRAIGADKRIAPYYLSGGLAFGGTCFPRDTTAYRTIAAQYGLDAPLIRAADEVNRFQDEHLLDVVIRAAGVPGSTVGVLGLAFKSDTPVITESPAIKLIEGLLAKGYSVAGYDELAMEETRGLFGDRIRYAASPEDALTGSAAGVLTYRSRALRDAVTAFRPAQPVTIVDCWRQLDSVALPATMRWLPMGRNMGGDVSSVQ